MAAPVTRIETAHRMYREGMHEEALDLFTEALAIATSKAQRIVLHSNRAACYLKLRDFKKVVHYSLLFAPVRSLMSVLHLFFECF